MVFPNLHIFNAHRNKFRTSQPATEENRQNGDNAIYSLRRYAVLPTRLRTTDCQALCRYCESQRSETVGGADWELPHR